MRRRYERCHICQGRVTERSVVVDYRWGDDLVAIIQHVPAGVCDTCGEQYFRSAVVKAMERAAHSPAKPRAVVHVPIRQLVAA